MFDFPSNGEAFAILTRHGVVRYCSASFAQALNATCRQLIGSPIESWLKPADGAQDTPWYRCAENSCGLLHGADSASFRYRIEPLSQYLGEIAESMLFIEGGDPAPCGALATISFHAFDLNPGLSAITVAETGEHLEVNRAWLRAMGYERHEIIGNTSEALRIWAQGQEERDRVFRLLRRHGKLEGLTAKLRTKSGEVLHILVNAILFEDRGRGDLALFTSHDVTNLKRAMEMQSLLEKRVEVWQEKSFTDALTGVANRRRFEQVLLQEWSRCGRHGRPLSVLFVDIDHFKDYNDHYGHQAGDACLRIVAQALQTQVGRAEDLLCRYGGEEFCCILPESDFCGAHSLAESLLYAVHCLAIPHERSPVAPHLTISIGIATTIPRRGERPQSLVGAADRNLYQAKLNGRARIEGGVRA